MQVVDALRMLDAASSGQAGLVTAAQARVGGVDGALRARLVRDGALRPVDRGVYLVAGAAEPNHLEIWIAWLRLNPRSLPTERDGLGADDGVVSHASACVLHEIGDIPAPKVELTVPRRRRAAAPYVRLRVRSDLHPDEVLMHDGLPVTTPARTIADLLREGADGGHVGGVIADAERRGLIDPELLAPRVARFAASYAMPGADGLELLTMLAVMSVPT